ncbi:DUF1345 domain-containing protein [Polymorphobacter fuscus]|uniref:DUF1345 domain-containing protein n=1 Tax=Sandarakinorhabdus fusca TaxID=1439888 RepID=A0A7C9GP89_9SPHN|nr:DUF1345 domain-containing protein [Polymorphobacter fuscus]KAB7648940.1 DUF1345 domain-containing protein [Polymorphobacter fuscus]MQT16530.1 DUF1345 domain-containing protein [Polymorphobacter fuscus]NJC07179.1 putative membrane protein [Polymorphobacter fuscus]
MIVRRYARFVAFLVVGAIAAGLAAQRFGWAPALLIGFDIGTLVFFLTLISMFRGATADSMRERSQANEPDHGSLLLLSMAIAGVTIAGVWTELASISAGPGEGDRPMIALAMGSLVLAWLFANVLGAIHYAHLWYLRGPDGKDARGLDFPGPCLDPDYFDFAYFAAVLSMTFQVSDVAITSKHMRRLALVHGLVAFLFNFSVIALSVNLVTGVMGT